VDLVAEWIQVRPFKAVPAVADVQPQPPLQEQTAVPDQACQL